jgi:hypothetical protein
MIGDAQLQKTNGRQEPTIREDNQRGAEFSQKGG